MMENEQSSFEEQAKYIRESFDYIFVRMVGRMKDVNMMDTFTIEMMEK